MKTSVAFGSLVTVLIALILLLAAMDYIHHRESNRCKMSYMFYNPFLRSLALTPPPPARLAGYKLFYYCSGECRPFATENALPILFLPGTRGSFKTVRSFASVQDYFQGNKAFQFDFFAVDFNEETTALSGNLIERQAEYLALSVDGILSIYAKSKNPPTSVVIVGHSLGILAAVHLLANPQFDRRKITTVISLAGPLLDPIYSPGPIMDRVYERVGTYFKTIAADSTHPLVIISLTGGSRDVLVPDVLGAVNHDTPGLRVLWLSTSSISRVWASCDHLCILWCRQLMHALTFALQDLRLLSPAMDRLNASTRLRVFRDRLISLPVLLDRTRLIDSWPPVTPVQVDRLPPGQWVFRVRQQTFRYTGILPPEGQFTKIGPFFDDPDQRVLITTNQVFGDWLFLCVDPRRWTAESVDDEHPCSQLIPLSKPYVTWVPDYDSAFAQGLALLTLPLTANAGRDISVDDKRSGARLLRPGSYLVVAHPPPSYQNSEVELILETFNDPEQRVLHMSDAYIPWHRPIQLTVNRSLTGSDPFLSVFHRIRFPGDRFLFSPSLPAPRLTVTNVQCSKLTSDGQGLMAFYAPWANYFLHSFINTDSLNTLDLDVPSPQPRALGNASLFVDLLLKPHCTYTISVHLSLFQWIAKLIRLHWAHLFGLVCAHLVLELCLVTWLQLCRSNPHARLGALREEESKDTGGIGSTNGSVQPQSKKKAADQSSSPTGSVAVNDDAAHLVKQPPYTRSVCMHLCAVGILFASLQFLNCSWSDWTRLYDYGHLGLRLVDSYNQPGPALPLSTRLIAHLPFLLLAVPVAILMPLLIRLYCVILRTAMCCSVRISRQLFNWQPGPSQHHHPWRGNLVLVGIFFLGLVSCEAVGVLLFAAHLFLQAHIYYHSQLVAHPDRKNAAVSSSSEKKTAATEADSGVNHSKSSIPVFRLPFYWHSLVIITTVMVSLFLVENWMEFLQAVDRYRETGYQHIGMLFRSPLRVNDWHALSVLGTIALAHWHHGQFADRFWSLASTPSRTSMHRSNFIVVIAYFFSGICLVCLTGLFHTAVLGYRLALLSAWAMEAVLCLAHCQATSAAVAGVSTTDADGDRKSKVD